MTSKTYLRYEDAGAFGVVAAHESNVDVDQGGLRAVASGVQDVLLWNLKSGELEHRFKATDATGGDPDATLREVTAVRLSPGDRYLAAGFACGTIRVWDFQRRKFVVSLNGHRGAVTCLRFSADNARLASGSRDTDLIVWDVVAQTGLFRLRGHKQEVTDCWFIETAGNSTPGQTSPKLISCSKDTLVKLWDLETQHCAHTFVGHRSPVWSLAVAPDGQRIFTASSDSLLRAMAAVSEAERASERAAVEKSAGNSAVQVGVAGAAEELGAPFRLLSGPVARQSAERAIMVQYSSDGRFLACQTAGKTLEVYRVRTADEVSRKVKRRLKRAREKLRKKGTGGGDDEDPPPPAGSEEAQVGDEIQLVAAMRTDHRMRSFAFGRISGDKVELVVSFNSNSIEVYSLLLAEVASEADDAGDDAGDAKKRKRDVQLKRSRAIELQGHRNDVRAIALSSDDTLVLTAASGAAKLWNVNTRSCIRTFPSGYSLCCAFVPGDMHALVGTKSGHLLLFNLSSGEVVHEVAAHDDAIWTIDVRPDGKGFATGSADKQVKFWEFELAEEEGREAAQTSGGASDADSDSDSGSEDDNKSAKSGASSSSASSSTSLPSPADDGRDGKRPKADTEGSGAHAPAGKLELVHVRTLKMSEDVMCVKYSHHRSSARLLLAVSLLDSTVKVFFEDSLKFCLSLYGHKLPVLSMDISSDNSLIATASADKNVKLWGLDFGDCHKSFFAHDAAVMCVRFVPRTHYFFTAGKDNRVRYWDADKFEMILSLERHVAEVWGLAVASTGNFVVSSGHDKALRVWERTTDIVFIDEERDKELEKRFDAKLVEATDPSKTGTQAVAAVKEGAPQGELVESGAASKRTAETLRIGERLMEAIDVAEEARLAQEQYAEDLAYAQINTPAEELARLEKAGKPLVNPPKPNILMMGRTPLQHVLYVLRGVKSNELDETLLLLPFGHATRLFHYLDAAFQPRSGASRLDVELSAKVAIALLRAHFKQIVATHSLKPTLHRLRVSMRAGLFDLQDQVGTNMAAVRALKAQVLGTSAALL